VEENTVMVLQIPLTSRGRSRTAAIHNASGVCHEHQSIAAGVQSPKALTFVNGQEELRSHVQTSSCSLDADIKRVLEHLLQPEYLILLIAVCLADRFFF